MPESVKSRTAGPLKTKTEKRAEAKAAKARARARAKRRRTLSIVGSAAGVLIVVVGLVVWISRSSSDQDPAAGPAAVPDATASAYESPAPSAPFPPVPAGADPALSKKPAATKGAGKVTKLTSKVLVPGVGPAVAAGQTVNVNYVGVTYADGKEFDSSWKRSEPFSFQVGGGNVIQGWDKGLVGAKVGSRVQLDIPADLAYGEKPTGGQPGGALRFVIDVLSAS